MCTAQAELKLVLEAVEVLQRKCDQASTEKAYLEKETDTTRARLIRAEKLTTGLASEGVRWKHETVVVAEQVCVHGLHGDCNACFRGIFNACNAQIQCCSPLRSRTLTLRGAY